MNIWRWRLHHCPYGMNATLKSCPELEESAILRGCAGKDILQRDGGILLAVRGDCGLPIQEIEDRLRTTEYDDVLA